MKVVSCKNASEYQQFSVDHVPEFTVAHLRLPGTGLSLLATVPPTGHALCAFSQGLFSLGRYSSALFRKWMDRDGVEGISSMLRYDMRVTDMQLGLFMPIASNSLISASMRDIKSTLYIDSDSYLVDDSLIDKLIKQLGGALEQFGEYSTVEKFGGPLTRVDWSVAGAERTLTHPQPGIFEIEEDRINLIGQLVEECSRYIGRAHIDHRYFTNSYFISRPAIQFSFPVVGHEFSGMDRKLFDARLDMLEVLAWPQFYNRLLDEEDFDEFRDNEFEWTYFNERLLRVRRLRDSLVRAYPVLSMSIV